MLCLQNTFLNLATWHKQFYDENHERTIVHIKTACTSILHGQWENLVTCTTKIDGFSQHHATTIYSLFSIILQVSTYITIPLIPMPTEVLPQHDIPIDRSLCLRAMLPLTGITC